MSEEVTVTVPECSVKHPCYDYVWPPATYLVPHLPTVQWDITCFLGVGVIALLVAAVAATLFGRKTGISRPCYGGSCLCGTGIVGIVGWNTIQGMLAQSVIAPLPWYLYLLGTLLALFAGEVLIAKSLAVLLVRSMSGRRGRISQLFPTMSWVLLFPTRLLLSGLSIPVLWLGGFGVWGWGLSILFGIMQGLIYSVGITRGLLAIWAAYLVGVLLLLLGLSATVPLFSGLVAITKRIWGFLWERTEDYIGDAP